MANPPFMSPKGGIKPHKRFSIQAKRSEVLFVDYMAEHLTPTGRAAIIVPEGIIFQSQTAYKQLRKMLIETSLVAVISLPAGVFNPYSGVKTSILILNKPLAKRSDGIAFFKVGNDGFGLGAQRRANTGEELTLVKTELAEYFKVLHSRQPTADFQPTLGQIVKKEKIAANGGYNLSGDRYREGVVTTSEFPHVLIRDVSEVITKGTTPTTAGFSFEALGINFVKIESVTANGTIIASKVAHISKEAHAAFRRSQLEVGDVLFSIAGAMGRSAVVDSSLLPANTNQALAIIRVKSDIVSPVYLSHLLRSSHILSHVESVKAGVAQYNISLQQVGEMEIPLPPIEVQREIVAELEDYQKMIDGARAVLDNYRIHIPIRSDWPMVELREICNFKNGLNFTKDSSGHTVKIIGVSDFQTNLYAPLADLNVVHLDAPLADDYLVKGGDILFVRSNGNPDLVGRSMIVPNTTEPTTFSGFTIRGRIEDARALPLFYAYFFKSRDFAEMIKTVGQGANIRNLSQGILNELKVPLPPLETQQQIVAEIEAEQALVAANRELIERFEKKIQAAIARVWGEEK